MTILRPFPWIMVALVFAGCATGPGARPRSPMPMRSAQVDSLAFDQILAAHLCLSDSSRATARQKAETLAVSWHTFERESKLATTREFDHLSLINDDPPALTTLYFGVGNSLLDLKQATDLDPSFVEGWMGMGTLSAQVGDLNSAEKYLNHALRAAAAMNMDSQSLLPIYRQYSWVLRDLAQWDKGLALVEKGLEIQPGDLDLVLVKGLLLAGAGRYNEALSVAISMKPLSYPQYDFLFRGLKFQTSAYANNWIRAMALLSVGEVKLAYAKIGDLNLYSYRGLLPYGARFWRDAALLAELVGDPQAPLYYGIGFVTRPYKYSYPVSAHNVSPQVLGIPAENLPVFTSYGPLFYIGGSPFVYVCYQINLMVDTLFDQQRSQAAGRAMQMLGILEKRNIRPEICHALRGRIYYANEDFELAEEQLTLASDAFTARGKIDPTTSLLRGLIQLRNKKLDTARDDFLATISADSTSALAWRSLAVVYAQQGRKTQAGQAMDQAVNLDPWNVAGLYNRGLFRLQNGKLGPAAADLQRAAKIDPQNREVQHLRDMVLASAQKAGLDSTTIETVARGTPLGEAANPALVMAKLQAEVDSLFTVPDSLRVGDSQAESRIETLTNRYMRDRDPLTRAVLALALIDHRKLVQAQVLLEPGWGVDLSPEEELMLLYVDHELGEKDRAAQVVRDAIAGDEGSGNPYSMAMAAVTIRTSVDPVAADPVTPITHGFFGWWRIAKYSFDANSGRDRFFYDFNMYRKYQDDHQFEQAIWGMAPTPITGSNLRSGVVPVLKQ